MSTGRREVIVEVGPGGTPATGKSKLVREKVATGQAKYIGIDRDPKSLDNPFTYNGEVYLIGNLGNLPIRDGVVDEVWIWNVFGEPPGRGGFGRNPIKRDGRLVISPWHQGDFCDLVRILKMGGRIIIAEDYTPLSFLAQVYYRDFGLQKEVLEPNQFIERYDIADFFQDIIRNATESRVYFGPPIFLELTKVGPVNSAPMAA